MSEHTPLTEAEPKYAVQGEWLVEYVNEHTCGTGRGGYYGAHEPGCGMEPVARIADILDALAARTSTATADTGHKAWERAVLERVVATMPACRETPDFMHALSTAMLETRNDEATADDGLRERVEALADSWERECRLCPCVRADVGYEGRDGIEPGEYCGARHREDYRRLMALRDALTAYTSSTRVAGQISSLGPSKWMVSGPTAAPTTDTGARDE